MASITLDPISVPGQQENETGIFPLVLTPSSTGTDTDPSLTDICTHINQERVSLLSRCATHGALMLRGVPARTAVDFLKVLEAFEFEYDDYVGGGGPRNSVLGPVHNSTDTPPEHDIPFHHELAYLTKYPSILVFFCQVPPGARGETPILLSSRLYHALKSELPEFVKLAEEKGVRYERVLQDQAVCDRTFQRSWQDTMGTTDRDTAECRARDTGAETVAWLEDGSMRVVSQVLPASIVDERTGVTTWFNSIILLHPAAQAPGKAKPWRVVHGDYSEMDAGSIARAKSIMDQHRVEIAWQEGDMMLVDNKIALHARNSFTPPRTILAAIAK